ncbi:AraC family transcriptional regulator [Notoacmeibacter ruber]|uniref:AraC family transcriptional regulator n=1 Tax=Notoacmeibacter ruber TaxID=2670375 RepID=A0A3L7J850_9HYPH|nr:AraC family transcriptional regulator [Notoacmeibacter ruber]
MEDLTDLSRISGTGFALLETARKQQRSPLKGAFTMAELRTGLKVHATDAVATRDFTTMVEQQPGLTIYLFLEGQVEATLGDVDLDLGRRADEPVHGVIVSRARPDHFTRRASKSERVRKVNVTLTPEWLHDCRFGSRQEQEALRRFSERHLAHFRWRADSTMIAIAEQMLHPPYPPGLLRNLYLESRALDLVAEAFAAFNRHEGIPREGKLRQNDRRRLDLIEAYIEAHDHKKLSLDDIAHENGVSVSTLSRLFHSVYGTGVREYLRSRALQKARIMLERDGVSVAEAAHAAGYNSAANFATAFKREFGMTPKGVRRS